MDEPRELDVAARAVEVRGLAKVYGSGAAAVRALRGVDVSFPFPWSTALVVAVAAVALGVLAAILPARRAARRDVIDALGYE